MKKTKEKKFPRKEHDGILRIPRPMGLTMLNSNTPDNQKQKIKDQIITLWINSDMQLNNKSISIQEMATYLTMTPEHIMRQMNREIERVSGFLDGEGKRLARVSWYRCLKKGSEIASLVANQAHILMAQQGSEYVPFLTAEVNKSLANLINSQKPLHDLLKMVAEKHTTNIFMPDTQSAAGGQNYITPEQALGMLNDVPTMYSNDGLIAAKEAQLLLEPGMPNVNARQQDLTQIGIKNKPIHVSSRIPDRHEIHHNRIPNEVIDEADLRG